jgi:hypothetical protein
MLVRVPKKPPPAGGGGGGGGMTVPAYGDSQPIGLGL